MKAVRIHDYGGPEVLRIEDAPLPAIGADDARVRIVGTSVNPVDWKIRQGHLQSMLAHALPLIPGWDLSGIVDAVGERVTRVKLGDAVFSRPDILRDGSYAEYIAVRADELALKPATVSHIEAASLPLAGIAAYQAIVNVAQVAPGHRVLVHAAAGGVGSLAVQVSRECGATVIGTASASNRALVESLGVNEFVDYRSQKIEDAVRDVDVVLDTVGGAAQEASWKVLNAGGLLVSIISPPSEERARAQGVRSAFLFVKPDAAILAQLARWVDSGRLRPVIGAEFALDDVARAQALSESGHARGKIVLYVSPP